MSNTAWYTATVIYVTYVTPRMVLFGELPPVSLAATPTHTRCRHTPGDDEPTMSHATPFGHATPFTLDRRHATTAANRHTPHTNTVEIHNSHQVGHVSVTLTISFTGYQYIHTATPRCRCHASLMHTRLVAERLPRRMKYHTILITMSAATWLLDTIIFTLAGQ